MPEKPFRNGIYFFFERGETVGAAQPAMDRIVRVGTHRGDGRLWRRLRLHYAGTARVSVFRRRIGGALLARNGADVLPDLEGKVTRCLHDNFTFACLHVDDPPERLQLESALIALLAQHPLVEPSPQWLGRSSPTEAIQRFGLWNSLELTALPMTEGQFARVKSLADG